MADLYWALLSCLLIAAVAVLVTVHGWLEECDDG